MNNFIRSRYRHDKSFTTDDIADIENQKTYPIIIQIEAVLNILIETLNEINEILYHENTKIILAKKPLFDKQKTILQSIAIQLEKNYNNGLVKRIRQHVPIKIMSLTTNTEFEIWNNQAKRMNNYIEKLNIEISQETQLLSMLESYTTLKTRIKKQYCSITRVLIVSILITVIFIALFKFEISLFFGE